LNGAPKGSHGQVVFDNNLLGSGKREGGNRQFSKRGQNRNDHLSVILEFGKKRRNKVHRKMKKPEGHKSNVLSYG